MSAFVRIYGRNTLIDNNIKRFCQEWSEKDSHAPLEGLNEVDKYFSLEYNKWRE